jgi:hypothetical protein
MANVSEALGACTVQDESGQPHQLGEVWSKRPVVLAFVRHFG